MDGITCLTNDSFNQLVRQCLNLERYTGGIFFNSISEMREFVSDMYDYHELNNNRQNILQVRERRGSAELSFTNGSRILFYATPFSFARGIRIHEALLSTNETLIDRRWNLEELRIRIVPYRVYDSVEIFRDEFVGISLDSTSEQIAYNIANSNDLLEFVFS